ncbi:MAG: methyl-accepting chemotaxis protein [Geminicoccaceae bacterium]
MSSSVSRPTSAGAHRWTIARKVPLLIIGATLAVAAATTTMAYMTASGRLLDARRDKLQTVVELRREQLEQYLGSIEEDARTLATSTMVIDALASFDDGWRALGSNPQDRLRSLYVEGNPNPAGKKDNFDRASDGSPYSEAHGHFHPGLRDFARERGYHDLFLVNGRGELVYSVFKEADFATNLVSGRWSDTDLGRAYKAARDQSASGQPAFFDFDRYEPRDNAPASFISSPILGAGGEFEGAVVLQMPVDRINTLLSGATGLGETGEMHIVGPDFLVRNDSRFQKDAILAHEVDNIAIRSALAGKAGIVETVNEENNPAEVAYAPVEFLGVKWALMAEMERAEIVGPAYELRDRLIVASLVVVAIAAALAYAFGRTIVGPIQRMARSVEQLSRGESVLIDGASRADEVGDLGRALGVIHDEAVSALRLKSALDTCQTNVMVADADYNIVYLNRTLEAMLRHAEADIRTELGNFDASTLIGRNIDVFHKNPAHQRSLLDKLSATYTTEIMVGGRTFNLVANPVMGAGGERLGTVVEWADRTEELKRQAEERRMQVEMMRVKSALDNCQTNVMVADENFNIVYLNGQVEEMLKTAEADIRTELPQFDARNLLGRNIDVFHKNPAHQRRMLDSLDSTYQTQIEVGVRTFSLAASPIVDNDGKRLGTVVEWMDRTTEIAIEREIDGVVEGAVAGDFNKRIAVEDKEGFHRNLAVSMNALCDMIDQVTADLGRILEALAKGDLTSSIENEYKGRFGEIREHANTTVEQLASIVKAIKESTGEIDNSVNEIAAGTEDLAGRTEQQASNLEETAASMEEMAATVKQNAENAQQANQLTGNTNSLAAKGGDVVEEAVQAMASIEESSQKISDIIGVIDEIAFQTNLLALNAAVEAARAGEAGKGFAVVASEVRTLAQRSSQAAKDIKALISDSSGEVRRGVKLVNDTGDALREIVTSVARVADIVGEITAASSEQANGIGEINSAVSQMDEMTQQNSALVEENTASARALADLAGRLNQMVGFFHIDQSQTAALPMMAEAAVQSDIRSPRSESARAATPAALKSPAARRPARSPESAVADDDWQEF